MVCEDTTIDICAQSRFVSMVVTSVLLYMSNTPTRTLVSSLQLFLPCAMVAAF